MSSIRSMSVASLSPSSISMPAPVEQRAPLAEDIPLGPLPPWGLAQEPTGLLAPQPKRRDRAFTWGCVAGVATAASITAVNVSLITIACTSAKFGATFSGKTWNDELNDPNSGYSGTPNQPPYGDSDQCFNVGFPVGFGGTIFAVVAGALVGWGITTCVRRGRGGAKAQPMQSLA